MMQHPRVIIRLTDERLVYGEWQKVVTFSVDGEIEPFYILPYSIFRLAETEFSKAIVESFRKGVRYNDEV